MIPEDRPVSVEREIFPALLQNGHKVAVYKGCSYWMDIGTPEKYMQTHAGHHVRRLVRYQGVHFDKPEGIYKDGKSFIDATAVITGPVYIGDGVRIGAYATVGPNAVHRRRLFVFIKAAASLNSVLWNNVGMGSYAKIDGVVATLRTCIVGLRDRTHSDTCIYQKAKSLGRRAENHDARSECSAQDDKGTLLTAV